MNSKISKLTDEIWSVTDLLRSNFKRNEYGRIILPFTLLFRLSSIFRTQSSETKEFSSIFSYPTNGVRHLFFETNNTEIEIEKEIGELIGYLHSEVQEIFEYLNFSGTVNYLNDSDLLRSVTSKFSSIELSIEAVSNFEMGTIFEQLINRVSNESSEDQGEYFTPPDIAKLITLLLISPDSMLLCGEKFSPTIYDPAVGTGGLLIRAQSCVDTLNSNIKLQMFGQEINPESSAICKASILLRGEYFSGIEIGDTLLNDKFDGVKFDYMLSHPPFGLSWKNVEKFVVAESENKKESNRFKVGLPRTSDSSLLFVLHLLSKMKPCDSQSNGSRIGLIMHESAISSIGTGESEIRRHILELDLLETIVALPGSMFYNTSISTQIWILSNRKSASRKNKVHLIDARDFGQKDRNPLGFKENYFDEASIEEILAISSSRVISEKTKFVNVEKFGYREIRILIDKKDSEIEKVPLGVDIEKYINDAIGQIHTSYAIDRTFVGTVDKELGRVSYDSTFDKLFGFTAGNENDAQFRSYFELKKDIGDDWDLAITKNGNIFFWSTDFRLNTKRKVWKFKTSNTDLVDLNFIKVFFESEKGIEWISRVKGRGGAISTINEYDLLRSRFPLPAIERQRNLVSLIQDSDNILKKVNNFKRELWDREVGHYILEKYKLPINVGLENQLPSICPYPLANIIHHYQNISDSEHKTRQELLLKFFESISIFLCGALLGACQEKVGQAAIEAFLKKQKRHLLKPTFGTWVSMLIEIPIAFSFGPINDLFIKSASNKVLAGLIESAKNIRNNTTGHGSFPTKQAAKKSLNSIENIFREFLSHAFLIFENYKLIRPVHSTWNGDSYNNLIEDFTGLGCYPFSQRKFTSKKPLIHEELYIISSEETEVIRLYPFVKLLEMIPDSSLEAFYFYAGKNQHDGSGNDEYHFISHQQIQEQSNYCVDKELNTIFSTK